ncbi:DUF6906 family protein [Clostridium tagluense]|nr:hypothetical protein [Clostridium tagluense]MCB2297764.1 hypothetical protein [Clostridium tagluense]
MRGYRPKLKVKKLLKQAGYDASDFLFVRKIADNLRFMQKSTGKIMDLKI